VTAFCILCNPAEMFVCPDMPAMPSTDFSQLSTLCASFGCHPGGLCNVKESMTDPSTSVTTCNQQQQHPIIIKSFSFCHHLCSLKAHSLQLNLNCTTVPETFHCSSNAVRYCSLQVTATASTMACSTEHDLSLTPCLRSWQASLQQDNNKCAGSE